MPKKQCEIKVFIRGVQYQIIAGLMHPNTEQLCEGLVWSRINYGKFDLEYLPEMALDLYEKTDQ
ncbi:MAG: hypothetical protein CMD99_05120 [Gammaproteobacteria bacterium]|nr:hypothetical protein [Gammaproteobacteria bacterium]